MDQQITAVTAEEIREQRLQQKATILDVNLDRLRLAARTREMDALYANPRAGGTLADAVRRADESVAKAIEHLYIQEGHE